MHGLAATEARTVLPPGGPRIEVLLDWTEKIPAKPGTWRDVGYDRDENCPEDVIHEAERKWGTRIPFEKAPPPLCG